MDQIGVRHSVQRLTVDTHAAPSRGYKSLLNEHGSEYWKNQVNRRRGSRDDEDHRSRDGSDDDALDSAANSEGLYASGTLSPEALSSGDSSRNDRQTSISFDKTVKLDTGHRQSMDDPLPKIEIKKDRPRGRSLLDELAKSRQDGTTEVHRTMSDSARARFHPITGEMLRPRRTRKFGEARDGLSSLNSSSRSLNQMWQPPPSSFTSSLVMSPPEGAVIPSDSSMFSADDPLPSPMDYASAPPMDEPPWPLSRRNSALSMDGSEKSSPGSLRLRGRRATRRSTSHSTSPAVAFLSQWGGGGDSAPPPQPDDEGQEIGDHSEYIIGRQVGVGGFSVIKEAFTIEEGEKVRRAVKIVRKQVQDLGEKRNDQVQSEFEHEVSIWRYLRHKYILPLIAVYDSPFATFCITDLRIDGTLFDIVGTQRRSNEPSERGLPARLAKRYTYQLGSAIRYLHEDVRVVHRDIKLENCLVDMSAPNAATEGGNLLLCDFGMADFFGNTAPATPDPQASPVLDAGDDRHGRIGPSQTSSSMGPEEPSMRTNTVMGSLQYACPEVIESRAPLFSPAADIWAYGVVMYALLVGDLPFQHTFQPKVQMMILKGEWNHDALANAQAVREPGGEATRSDVFDVVKGCLSFDADARWEIAEVLESRWLKGCRELYEPRDPW